MNTLGTQGAVGGIEARAGFSQIERFAEGYVQLGETWEVLFCSLGLARLVAFFVPGLAEVVGTLVWSIVPQIAGTEAERCLREARATGEVRSTQVWVEPLRRWWEVRACPEGKGLSVFVRDVTEARQAREALDARVSANEQRLRLLDRTLSHLTDLAYSFDQAGVITYANRRMQEFLGLPWEDLVGKRITDLAIPPDLARRLHEQVLEVVRTGRPVKDETVLAGGAGEREHHEYTFNPVLGPAGEVCAVAGSTRSITERKRAEAIGEAQRRVLQYMAENRPLPEVLEALVRMVELQSERKMYAMILLADEEGRRLRHGASPSLPAEINRRVDGVEIAPMMGVCGAAAFSRKPVAVADILVDPRCAAFVELASAAGLRACWSMPIISVQGKLLGTFAQYFTEPREPSKGDWRVLEMATRTAALAIDRKRVEAALRHSEERFRRLSDSAPVPIWMTDRDKACTWANRTFLEFTGRTLEQVVGRAFEVVVHPDDLQACMERFDRCFDERREFEIECRMRRHDGCWRWWLVRGIPLYGGANEFTGYIGSCVDVTDKREVQADLERLVTERTWKLMETNAQLETLVYSIAHDLRAPLRSLKSFAGLLVEECQSGASEEARGYARRIERASGSMDALVTDLLAYGRVARSELELKRVQVMPAWRDALAQCDADITARGARIETRGAFPAVHAHEGMLAQVLANLLGNALKFVAVGTTPQVTFRAEEFGRTVRLWVEDNGIGIAPQHHERIFRVFERLNGREYGGTGIGLSIVRKGVERMGGKVGVISTEGQGARFWVELAKG